MKLPLKLRVALTLVITLLVWSHIVWDYFHEGIPTHYLSHNGDLPGIPNWLGGLVLPFFTWILLYRVHKRIDRPEASGIPERLRTVIIRLLLSMGIAMSISVFFVFEIDVIAYIMLAIFVLAFIFPLHKAEYLLGWVLGSAFTFGAIIPMGFGSILAVIFLIVYKLPRVVFKQFQQKETG